MKIENEIDSPITEHNYEITEVCPHCDNEITMIWNVQKQGYKAFCPVCGKRLMLCDECLHNGTGLCDYDDTTDTCKFNPVTENFYEDENGYWIVEEAKCFNKKKLLQANSEKEFHTMNNKFLAALLQCNEDDLKLLDTVKYNWKQVLDCFHDSCGKCNLTIILNEALDHGLYLMSQAIEEKIDILENTDNLTDDQMRELEALKKLDCYNGQKGDILIYQIHYNELQVECVRYGEIYEKYLQKELNDFYQNTGYAIKIEPTEINELTQYYLPLFSNNKDNFIVKARDIVEAQDLIEEKLKRRLTSDAVDALLMLVKEW